MYTRVLGDGWGVAVGGGLGWAGGVASYIWYSMDVRAEWPPFFSAAKYMISPFFQQKVSD